MGLTKRIVTFCKLHVIQYSILTCQFHFQDFSIWFQSRSLELKYRFPSATSKGFYGFIFQALQFRHQCYQLNWICQTVTWLAARSIKIQNYFSNGKLFYTKSKCVIRICLSSKQFFPWWNNRCKRWGNEIPSLRSLVHNTKGPTELHCMKIAPRHAPRPKYLI